MPRKAKPSEVLALAEGARKSLDVAELAHALLSEFGGIGEFAAAYVAEYKIAKAGTVAKAKMLESVLRMVSWASSRDQGGDDAGSLTDDELDQEIAAAARAAGIVGDPDHDDTPAAPQAA